MDYFIGIDIGTSSVKAVAFAADGNVLQQHAVTYGLIHLQPDWSEQDPFEIREAVIDIINHIAQSLAGHRPVLVSFSAAMHSLMAVGGNGQPLTRCMIWADNRAVEIAESLRATETGKRFYHKTGVPVHAMSPMCKIIWLKENRFGLFSYTLKFIGIKEFIFHSFFDKYIIDKGIASATGLFNIHTGAWDDEVMAYTGIYKDQLSQVVGSGHTEFLLPENIFSNRLPVFNKTAFVVGGGDGGLANLGSGAMDKGTMSVTVGTSGAARMVTREVNTDDRMRTFCYHLKEGYYITGGASNNGGIVLQWLKDNLLQSDETTAEFFNLAASVPPGCDDLLFLPYILGERAPLWNSNARGVFFGLSIIHTKAHLVRAAMEAVIFNLYGIGKILMERVPVTIIFANGGFANSPLWIQMLADMFNVPVFVNGIEESSAWGAVIMGMEAMGISPTIAVTTTGTKYEPSPASHKIYADCFEKFVRVYGLLKSEFAGTNKLSSNFLPLI